MNGNKSQRQWSLRGYLVATALLFLTNEVVGTAIAIRENLPSVTYIKSGLPAWEDFLIGFGTALSVPFVLFTAGSLAEPITYRVLTPATFDLPKALVVVAHIVLSLLMIGLGGWELSRRGRAALHLSKQPASEAL